MGNSFETKADIERMIAQLNSKKSGFRASHEKIAMKCIQGAQVLQDEDLEFSARMAMLHVMDHSRNPNTYISMFPWLLRKCDEDRERFDYDGVMLSYRSVTCYARQYVSVSKEKLIELMNDVEKRMRDLGAGDKVIHDDWFEYYREMGEIELASKQLELFRNAQSGRFVKCRNCEKLIADCFLIDQGKYKELLEIIDPVLRGEVTCHSNEFLHFHMAMTACMMLGRWEEAKLYDIRSRQKLDIEIALLYPFSSHLVYYGVTEQFSKGRTVFEKQFSLSKNEPDLPKMEFMMGALEFFKRMQSSGRETVKLEIPATKSLQGNDSIYAVSDLITYLENEINRIATAFDKRNENGYYQKFIRDLADRYRKLECPDKLLEID